MRAVLVTTAASAAALVAAPVAAAAAAPGTHTIRPARITKAVRSAERSRGLWATINICSSRGHPNDLGVRGQMPTLGFSASLAMAIQVDYWSAGGRRFIPIQSPTAMTTVSLGDASTGLQQGGAVFPFNPKAGLLNATITFTWTRAGKVIGKTHRRTTAGHHDADFGSPARYSAAQCRIK